jgi:hypothetical protein
MMSIWSSFLFVETPALHSFGHTHWFNHPLCRCISRQARGFQAWGRLGQYMIVFLVLIYVFLVLIYVTSDTPFQFYFWIEESGYHYVVCHIICNYLCCLSWDCHWIFFRWSTELIYHNNVLSIHVMSCDFRMMSFRKASICKKYHHHLFMHFC